MIRIIDNIMDFQLIKEDCNRLADNFQLPLLRYEWLINCANVLSNRTKLHIVVLISEGKVKAIAPLVIVKKYFSESLEMLGACLHGEPTGFLYEDENSLLELLQAVHRMKKTIFYNDIREFSLESFKLGQLINHSQNIKCINNRSIPFIPITDTLENFQLEISASRRSSIRRLLRIAESMGKVSIEIFCPAPDSVDRYLDEIFEVEASGWKKKMGTAMMFNEKLGEFFRSYLKDAAVLSMLRFCFLRIDGTAIAVQIGLEYANRFWILKIGYDEKWSKCSPGIILMNEVISYAFNRKLNAVEFLGSNEEWLHIWTNHFHEIVTYRIYNSVISCFLNLTHNYTVRLFNKVNSLKAKRKIRIGELSNA